MNSEGNIIGLRESSEIGRSGLEEVSRDIQEIAKEISEGMQEMAAGAEQISRAVKRVDDISVYNKTQIETLVSEISRFKVE
jgi:methyl-accepting chemotaxis protein